MKVNQIQENSMEKILNFKSEQQKTSNSQMAIFIMYCYLYKHFFSKDDTVAPHKSLTNINIILINLELS